MEDFIERIRASAKGRGSHIVLAEGEDDRVLQAAAFLLHEDICRLTLLGPCDLAERARRDGLDISDANIINPQTSDLREHYAQHLLEKRRHKGLSVEQAAALVKDPIYFATVMVDLGHADGMVCGATHTTPDSLRPALQIIKTRDGINKASSFFIMKIPDRDDIFFFTDCAFIPHPTAEELAESALLTAEAAESLGITPRIAMLSFSTKGSAHDPAVDRTVKATQLLRQRRPDYLVDGELQLDAAIVPEVAARKAPHSPLEGRANILVFPSLNAGNIGYKLVERFGHARPIGPIITGLRKPVNDVSRGCDVNQIIDAVCLTIIEGDFS